MTTSYPSSRRRFVQRFALGMAGLSVPGRAWRSSMILSLEAAPPTETGTLRLTFTDFPSLEQDYGSVRLTANPVGSDHFPQGNLYPLLVNRAPGGRFYAMTAECTHASCVVDSYDELEQGLRCPCHRSLYGLDGTVLIGPAERSLKQFPLQYDGKETLTIQVPGLAFRVTPSLAVGTGGRRLRMVFPTEPNVTYEVRFRASLAAPGQAVPFASSIDGPLDQTEWLGDEQPAEVFVEAAGAGGFFEVSMVFLEG